MSFGDHDWKDFDDELQEEKCNHNWRLDSSTRIGDTYICNNCGEVRRE